MGVFGRLGNGWNEMLKLLDGWTDDAMMDVEGRKVG